MCEKFLHLQCFSVVTCSMVHQEKRGTEKKLIPICWLDLLWPKNVNGQCQLTRWDGLEVELDGARAWFERQQQSVARCDWKGLRDSFLFAANLAIPKASNTASNWVKYSSNHQEMEISDWSWPFFFFSLQTLYLSTPHIHCRGKPLTSLGGSIDCCIKVLSSMATDPEGWNEHQTISALSPSPSVSAFSPSLELSPIMLGHQFCPLHSQPLHCNLYPAAVHAVHSWHSFQDRVV